MALIKESLINCLKRKLYLHDRNLHLEQMYQDTSPQLLITTVWDGFPTFVPHFYK